MLKEILIAASELSMANGEFVFVGFQSDIDVAQDYLPHQWGRPDFYEEPRKCNADHFATYDIIFCKEVESPVKLDYVCRQKI